MKGIRPIQWLTSIIGLFHNCATVRATTATDTRGAPIPGPTTKVEIVDCQLINHYFISNTLNSDCPGYPGIRGYPKRQGTRVAIQRSEYPSVKK